MKNKAIYFVICLLLANTIPVFSQTIQLSDCIQLAEKNYPQTRQLEIIQQTKQYNIENASKGNYPQLNIQGTATYQSDVTALPIKIPNMSIPALSKDQYRIYAEMNQPLLDWATVSENKKVVNAYAEMDAGKVHVELYKLRERVQQIYFAVLLFDEQLRLTKLMLDDIENTLVKMRALFSNGMTLQAQVQNIQAEKIRVQQKQLEMQSARKAYIQMLGILCGQSWKSMVALGLPNEIQIPTENTRPELHVFDQQSKWLQAQSNVILRKNLPHVNAFLQTGYGRPALNMLNNDFTSYYIGGLRLQWNITSLYTQRNDRKILSNQNEVNTIQRELFVMNSNIAIRQQLEDLERLNALLISDDELVGLRKDIVRSTKDQLLQGITGANEYIRDLNAQEQAEQNKRTHTIQRLSSLYQLAVLYGNK